MKIIVSIAILVALVAAQTVIVQSGVETTTIISPAGKTVALDTFHNSLNSNFLGTGAQWIWESALIRPPKGYTVTFQSLFYSDCSGDIPGQLIVTADDNFTAHLNGGVVGSGQAWNQKFTFGIKLNCGLNNLTITVINLVTSSPAALIFAVVQDKTNCYKCFKNSLGYFNRNTCNC